VAFLGTDLTGKCGLGFLVFRANTRFLGFWGFAGVFWDFGVFSSIEGGFSSPTGEAVYFVDV